MSLNYSRELLKISISELCSSIGFDSTSEIVVDILVDICERQFEYLIKQTSNLVQSNDQYQINYLQILFILLENNSENLSQLKDYLKQFQLIQFSKDIIQFPYKKRNQFYLRIPPKDSEQIFERDNNQTTEYIYDWLPLFPDQETPEQSSTTTIDTNLDLSIANDPDKRIDKNDSHHPLTLLSFLSQIGDETNLVPSGKRPNRSLPKILYRPRRIIEIEVAVAAAEKAKKEQIEKENVEKDQQQSSQPPLRLTIPKPVGNTENKPLATKKSLTTSDGILNKKPSSTSALNTNSSTINLSTKFLVSPTINQSNEIHSQINNSADILPNIEKNDETVLDLTKPTTQITPTTKVPTIKLNIKNVSNPQIANNSEIPTTATKKSQKSTTNHEKVNLKIRTSSLPLFGTNENPPMISPTTFLPTESTISSNELSTPTNLSSINQQTTEILQTNNRLEPISSQNVVVEEKEKKKKKKKKHHYDNDEKRLKKEENNSIEPMDIEQSSTIHPSNSSQGNVGGAIRLKIKLGKASLPSDEILSSTNVDSNEHQSNSEIKINPIRLNLSSISSNSSPILTHPSIDQTKHRRKSGKIQHIKQLNDKNLSFQEDNTNSIDDLPLGERTSPNKTILNNIQTNFPQQILSTPIKKKSHSNKKKTNINKRQNNIVGVAVIEERRIHHDSQEKIWICPSCNRPDNGQEAMIACDLCDDWYHWECVGIVEEPLESISWFCPKCHRSNSSTTSAQGIKPSASSKAKRQRASALYQQKQHPLI